MGVPYRTTMLTLNTLMPNLNHEIIIGHSNHEMTSDEQHNDAVCPFLGEEVICFMIYGTIGIKEHTRRALFRHRSSASPPHRCAAATAGGRHQLDS
jgi:hypothetical protein